MTRTINAPIRLIKEFKDDKSSLEMLACAIIVKAKYQNSCAYSLDTKRVMALFGVSAYKAKKLKEAIKSSPLFAYNERKDCAFAKSFKSSAEVDYYGRHRQFRARHDYCRKITVEPSITLREMVKILRCTLLMYIMHACDVSNYFTGVNKKTRVVKPQAKGAIPMRKLQSAVSLGKTSTWKLLKDLSKSGDIKKDKLVVECVIPELNEVTGSDYVLHHNADDKFGAWQSKEYGRWSGWVVYGRKYSIQKRDVSNSFKHVIYNYRHHRREKPEMSCENDGDGYWCRHS